MLRSRFLKRLFSGLAFSDPPPPLGSHTLLNVEHNKNPMAIGVKKENVPVGVNKLGREGRATAGVPRSLSTER